MTANRGPFPADLMTAFNADEIALVNEVSARSDTASLIIQGDDGHLLAYAVIGADLGGMLTVYAARAFNSIVAKAAMMGLLGAASVMGKPVRVHTDRVQAMARMMGAEEALNCLDGDGLPMGVFYGV